MSKNNLIKKIFVYIFVIFIVSFIFFLSLKIRSIYPFGDIDFSKCDGIYQYKPILFEFINSIKNGTIKSFNFLNGLGNPTIFNYLYYLSSPLNLFGMFFKNPDAIYISVIFIKTLFTSVFALFYFKKRISNDIISIICSLSYVFCGWYIAYYFNIMWLDSFMIFPLLQYGLEELMDNNKCYMYIFSLAYTMISNFYMAFMICIYIFIYYMFNIIVKKDKYINKIKNFQLIMFSTIVTGLLCSFTIYATYSSFLKMGIYVNSPNVDSTFLTFWGVVKSFFYGNISTNISLYDEVIPNISVSIIFLISLLYYFINDKITFKQKILTFISFVFIILVICSKQMNFLINCFHMPICYNFRYSFVISFYILIIFVRNYKSFQGMIDFKVFFINILMLFILIVNYCLGNIVFEVFIFNLVFLLCYTILIIFYSKNIFYKLLFLSLIILEMLFGFVLALDNKQTVKSYNYDTLYDKENRSYLSDGLLVNDNLYSSTNTIETFSSMQYNNVIDFLDRLGCSTDLKANIYACNENSVFSMLFNIEGEYVLPKIYAVNKKIYDYSYGSINFFDNLNSLVLGMSGIDNIIVEEKLELNKNQDNLYIYKVSYDYDYIFLFDDNIKYVKINDEVYSHSLNDIPSEYMGLNITTEINYITSKYITLNKGDQIEIMYNNETIDSLSLYYVDDEKKDSLYNYLKSNSIEYKNYQDDFIEGKINLEEDEVVFTSIPYDTSWHVYIDGEEKNISSLDLSLLTFDCPSGEHEIRLEYKENFSVSIIVSFLTLIGLVINYLKKIMCWR